MGRHVWSDEDKAEALELLADPDKTFYEVRSETDVPVGTLHRWAAEANLERSDATTHAATERRRIRLQAKREALAETFLDRAAELEGRMDEPHIDFRGKDNAQVEFPQATSADVRNYAVAVAVLIDKFRLEMGEATGRVEVNERPSKQVETKLDELSERRQEKTA